MFRELPQAFLYQYESAAASPEGAVIKMTFSPNPAYEPPARETYVYRAMNGTLEVSVPDYRLVSMEGKLFREVIFGWGLLGHLDKGGHFFVRQSKIGPHRWETTYMNIQFTGKMLLFKTINLREVEKLSDFQPVPDGLTLAQGIERLEETVN
jgi:hypothetical protein